MNTYNKAFIFIYGNEKLLEALTNEWHSTIKSHAHHKDKTWDLSIVLEMLKISVTLCIKIK